MFLFWLQSQTSVIPYLAQNIQTLYLISNFKYRPVADWAKSAGVKQFLYISSAGIYKPTDEPPHVEGV